MHALAENATGRWAISGAVAVITVAAVLGLFRAPEISGPREPVVPRPTVTLQALDGSNAAFDEKTLLMDPTPLFLPTKWNAAQKPLVGPEPGKAFTNYAPNFSTPSGEKELKLDLPIPIKLPATPVDLLAGSPVQALLGFGRNDVTLPALARRGAFLEIAVDATGRKVLRRPLLDAKPPGEGDWEPMEFLVFVDAMGAVGAPVQTRLSGVPEVDRYFQRYLAQTLRVGQRLPQGFYRISVGP